jgi:hypothetical protein
MGFGAACMVKYTINQKEKRMMTHFEHIPKNEIEKKLFKLALKAGFYFRVFVINIALVTIVWLLSLTGLYEGILVHFMKTTPEMANMYMMNLLGFWKIINVAFFLAPGLAICWGIMHIKKHMKK